MRLPAAAVLVPAAPEEVGLAAALPARLDTIARAAVADRAASGIAVAAGRWGRLVHQRGYGATDWAPGSEPVTDSTIFDLASLTKVVATTAAVMALVEDGRL
ncbi:MAG TPA: serine hydrolase, partial [Longimicrobiaceae bacterium]|nr:serine hydrolase [Longimicrobiaceae bacterium]